MNYAIKRILILIDFSAITDNALRLAAAIARRHNAGLHLLNIVPAPTLLPSMDMIPGGGDELAALMAASKKHLAHYKDEVELTQQITVTATSEFGALTENVCAYIKNKNIDLTVIGTSGIAGWKEFLYDSVAMSIIKESICPVLAVPINFKKTTFDKVLYPIRNVVGVVEKYGYIKDIAVKNNSSIHLLGLIEKGEDREGEFTENIKKIIDIVLNDKDEITYETLLCENIAGEILEKLHAREDDLVVINVTLDIDWQNFFSGSYTQQIVNHTTIPVLALKV